MSGLSVPVPSEAQRIYFALRGDLVKIGITTSLHYRMKNLGAELLASFEGTVLDERAMHRRFAEFSVGGEWFLDCPDIRGVVDELNEPPTAPPPSPQATASAADPATYTLAEAAEMLGRNPRAVAASLAKGRQLHPDVPAVRILGRWHVAKAPLDRLLGVEAREAGHAATATLLATLVALAVAIAIVAPAVAALLARAGSVG